MWTGLASHQPRTVVTLATAFPLRSVTSAPLKLRGRIVGLGGVSTLVARRRGRIRRWADLSQRFQSRHSLAKLPQFDPHLIETRMYPVLNPVQPIVGPSLHVEHYAGQCCNGDELA